VAATAAGRLVTTVDEGVDCGGSAVLFLDLPVASATQEEEDAAPNG